ncbi:MAG: O-antigen ligase family protein [Candidatus Omnitrophota bacterium]
MKSNKKIVLFCEKISEWSLYIMIIVLPFSKTMLEITIIISIVSIVLKKILNSEKIISDKNIANIFLAIFIMASLVSLFNSPYLLLSVKSFFTKILKFAALFLAAKEIINTRVKLSNFAIMAVISCIVILIDGFLQYFFLGIDVLHSYPAFGVSWDNQKLVGVPTASFPFPNDFAAWILIFIFPMGSFFAFGGLDKIRKFLMAFIFSGLLYFLIITKVRGAWASFICGLSFLFFLKPKTIGIILLIVILFAGGLVCKQAMPHIKSMTSVHLRESMWGVGVEIFKKHPVIGNGVNTFFNRFKEERQDDMRGKKGSYAHNCYLQMACDTGLFGLLSFIAFSIAVIATGCRIVKEHANDLFLYPFALGITVGLIAYLAHSAVDTNLYSLPLAALFWLSAGVLFAIDNLSKTNL